MQIYFILNGCLPVCLLVSLRGEHKMYVKTPDKLTPCTLQLFWKPLVKINFGLTSGVILSQGQK